MRRPWRARRVTIRTPASTRTSYASMARPRRAVGSPCTALGRRAARVTGCRDARRGAAIDARGEFMVVLDESGHDLGDCDRNGRIEAGETSALVPASLAEDAYDLLAVERDKSFGFHNHA